MSKIPTLRAMEIVTKLEFLEFYSPEDEKNYVLESIRKVLDLKNKNGNLEYAYIIHDKDIDDEGNVIDSHVHIALRFNSPRKIDAVSSWFGLQSSTIEKVKGKWVDVLQYLTHANSPEKHQYEYSEVRANFDFETVLKQLLEEKAQAQGKKRNSKWDMNGRLKEIDTLINEGILREYNLHEYVNSFEYAQYKTEIDRFFLYRQNKLLEELAKGEINMEVNYFTGESGSGKTTLAKMIAEKSGYSVFISGSSNDPFDGYKGQDCIILDDLRGSSFALADLLKITDNNTNTPVKSRFKNKVLECKLLIITSIHSPEIFFNTVFQSYGEPIEQFYRRLTYVYYVEKDKLHIFQYDDTKKAHIPSALDLKNPVPNYVRAKKLKESNSIEKKVNLIESLFAESEKEVNEFTFTDEEIPF